MRKILQQNEGITLIALVITIIVLLILAGVTIATLVGDNGIIKRAADARDLTKKSRNKRQNTNCRTYSYRTRKWYTNI